MNHSRLTVRTHGFWKLKVAAFFAVPLLAVAAQAAEPTLASGTVPGVGDVRIDATDVGSDILRIPVDVRPQVLTQPRTMKQLVTNLYTRRALAQSAQVKGLDKSPEVVAALALARDKVLSDALLVQVDKDNTPPEAKAEALARTMYQANSKDFQQPERVDIRHILIAVKDSKDDAAAAKQAQDLLAQLRAGGDFTALAKEYSADAGTANKGGDLGFFAAGQMVPEFDKAAFALKNPGDISDVIKTDFGYHILQLKEHKPAGQQPFADVKGALVAKVLQTEQQKGRVALAEQLESTMKLDEPAVKAAFEKLVPTAPAAPAKP